MRVPAALVALPLLAGAATGALLFDSAPSHFMQSAAAGAALALVAAAAAMADGSSPDATAAIVVGTLSAGLSLGLTAAHDTYGRVPAIALDEPVTFEGWLRDDATPTATGAGMTLDVVRASPAGRRRPAALVDSVGLRLGVTGAAATSAAGQWRSGRLLRVTAIVRPPATYRNFGVPDEARSLARRRVALVGTVKSAALVEIVRRGSAVDEAAGELRAWARARLAASIGRRSARSAAIAAAILIGDRSGIADDDERRLQMAGTYHVIAISGGNIAILTAIIMFLLRAGRVPSRSASAAAVVLLLFYGRLTGAPPSVARAITAAVIYLAARVIDHRGPALNALAVAAAGAVALFPLAAFDAGFILSFGATLGILLGVPRLVAGGQGRGGSRLRRGTRLAISAVVAMCAATLCAEAALLPPAAAIFARVTFAGLLLNLLAIPLMTIVQAASIATLALAGVPPASDAAGMAAHASIVGLIESARLVDVVPWLSIEALPPAWWIVAVYYLAWIAVLASRPPKGRTALTAGSGRRAVAARVAVRAASAAIALSTAAILLSPSCAQRGTPLPAPHALLRVVFLDVGQGDATLVKLPGGRSLLVDAGGLPGSTFDTGERVVVPALRALGVRHLDALLLTHADPDHVGGAPSVVRRLAPAAVWEGVPVPPNPALRELGALAAAQSAAWRTLQAGDVERLDDVDVRVWHPPPPEWERQRVRNDDSVVIELRKGDVSVLLTGDIEGEAERALAGRLALAPVVVLKAPHHGSATSSSEAFIKAAHPAAVVISAGRRNPFGHPHPAVVARYHAAGVEIFRTDEDGAVVVDTDGRTVTVRTFSGRQRSLSR